MGRADDWTQHVLCFVLARELATKKDWEVKRYDELCNAMKKRKTDNFTTKKMETVHIFINLRDRFHYHRQNTKWVKSRCNRSFHCLVGVAWVDECEWKKWYRSSIYSNLICKIWSQVGKVDISIIGNVESI